MSALEDELAFQFDSFLKSKPFEREFPAIPGRKFKFDFAFPDHKLLVEVDGGTYSGGRHTRGDGIEKDCEKVCLAAGLGYRVMRLTAKQVKSGEGVTWTERALGITAK